MLKYDKMKTKCILSRARQFVIDFQFGHALRYLVARSERTIAQKSRTFILLLHSITSVVTDPAEKVRPDNVILHSRILRSILVLCEARLHERDDLSSIDCM